MGRFDEDLKAERKDMPSAIEWLRIKARLGDIREATLEEQKRDIDLFSGKYSFEVKIRRKKYSDILFEVLSCEERKTPGWLYKSKAGFLVYIFKTKAIEGYILNLPMLKDWWIREGINRGYEKHRGKTKRQDESILYHTLNFAVPIKDIPIEIFWYHEDYGLIKTFADEIDPSYLR